MAIDTQLSRLTQGVYFFTSRKKQVLLWKTFNLKLERIDIMAKQWKKARKQAKACRISVDFKNKKAADKYVTLCNNYIYEGDFADGCTLEVYRSGKTAVLRGNAKAARMLLKELE